MKKPLNWDLDTDPFKQFNLWYLQMINGPQDLPLWRRLATKTYEAVLRTAVNQIAPAMNRIHKNTMVVATTDGIRPAARVVLLKSYDESGFVFYTNFDSNKGQDLEKNSNVEALFYWEYPQRQVRIAGRAKKLSYEESSAYWNTRPLEAQISQAVSPQSQVVESYDWLLDQVKKRRVASAKEIPCPKNWGGYRIEPEQFEFWQAGLGRLHRRYRFSKKNDQWELHWLAP